MKKPSKGRSSVGSTRGGNRVAKRVTQTTHKRRSKRDAKARRRADYRATLPKSRIKRLVYRLHPRRLYRYWFSRDGVMMALKLTGVSFGIMIVFSLGVFAYFRRDLPDPRNINARNLNQSTKFYDRTGKHLLFEVYGDENRTIVEFDQISDAAKWATVAIEDKDFYNHGGVSFSGVLRAAWSNLTSGDATGQGGSTITQQFIKNSLLTTDQTYTRKVQEVILALELERLYSKDEILSFYLNEIPYGPQEYGIQAAAQSYFRKDAKDLGIAEAAMLAALPQAPSYFSPYGENTEDLIERQQTIIDLMRSQGYITSEEADKAKEVEILATITPIDERSLYTSIQAPHFVLEVQRQLEEDLFGAALVRSGGLKIITTLDLDLQKIAEKAIKDADNGGFCDNQGLCGDNAAIVATDVETGQIIAMVGSRRFTYPGYGSYNSALADRQPGSSFKPFNYAQLFYNERWGPDSFIYDTRTTWGSYRPINFDGGYRGKMRVRQALGESRNIPAVKAIDIARPENVVGLAIAMGNESLADDPTFPTYDLSYGLGAGEVKLAEHAHAYGTFARGGVVIPQSYIISVENADGDKLLEWEAEKGEQVLDEEVAYLMTHTLSDDGARSGTFGRGNSNLVVPGLNHTVKTGTTDESVDGWMMGYSAYMSVGVWVGNHDNEPMGAALTSHQTGPIFTQFLGEAHEKKKYDFQKVIQERPSGIQSVKMEQQTGYAATEETKKVYTGLFPSWYQPETRKEANTYVIDTISGKLATECTPERAKEEKTGGGLWPEVLPDDYRFAAWSKSAGYDNTATGPEEEDDVHSCNDSLPNISLDVTEVGPGVFDFEADVTRGTFDLDTLNFTIDGQIVYSESVNKNNDTVKYQHFFTGDGTVRVGAEVIDEGLYDNSNFENVNVNGTTTTLNILSHVNNESGVSPGDQFQWNTVASADSYNFCFRQQTGGGSFDCRDTGSDTDYTPAPDFDPLTAYRIKAQAVFNGSVVLESSELKITTSN